jgi:exosortase O
MIFTPSQYHHWGTMPFGLLLTTLPFSYNFNVIFGFPLRLKIAELIQSILALVGIQTVGSETIILIENRASHIDYTCSGIQGICCSFICFFALSWIERKKLSLSWFLLLAGFIIATLTGNIIRVLLLVLLYGVYDQPALADMIHMLCGLLTFIIPSVIVYLLFSKTSWFPERTLQVPTITFKKNPLAAYTLLFIFMAIIIFVPHAKNKVLLTAEQIEFSPKDGMVVKDIPLTSGENRLFYDYAVPSYCKKEFKSGNSTGSFFLIKSDHFKAHHNPQNCLQSNGFRVSDSRMFLFDINFPVRYLSLNGGSSTAYFWFTSKKTITDDYSERMWNHFFNNKEIWIMASVVFDGEYTPENKDVRTVILSLQQTINTLLERPDHGNYCFTKP